MADFTICDNILIDFDSHNINNDDEIFKTYENCKAIFEVQKSLIFVTCEKKSGNLGIGNTTPDHTLSVAGNLYVRDGAIAGNTQTTVLDIAELFPVENDVSEGDVVCLKANGKACHCDKEFDNKILGVISTNPAIVIEGNSIVLGIENYSAIDGKLPIALKGKVPVKAICKVPIKQGDLLVSSNKKGYVMKLDLDSDISWKQATGTILGKALEPCKSGEKTIMAWVG